MITPAHVVEATDAQLICITYELFLEAIHKALGKNDKGRAESINHAKDVLGVLTENLNFEVPLSHNLFNLYVYIQNILINHYKEDDQLKEAYELIEIIYKGYTQVAKESEEVVSTINNAQTVYAGMTYGKGYLNEVMIEQPNRGFKA